MYKQNKGEYMKKQVKGLKEKLKARCVWIDEEWDRLDSQGRAEDQRLLIKERERLEKYISDLEYLLTFLE
jgi:hypothetical protein